eukprot:Phypoly_transcript_05615.p1 GENE.Phypoly_transcript_05615~~Phypoly_transcript_05615.p1  ORF type:complete len:220 (+),score=43.03 Phypoly_transcript_05615:1077-1736(+)
MAIRVNITAFLWHQQKACLVSRRLRTLSSLALLQGLLYVWMKSKNGIDRCNMVLHGAPKALDTLYARPAFCYAAREWRIFVPAHRRKFLVRTGVIHFVGFAKSHVFRRSKKKKSSDQAPLMIYQILRLLFVAEAMVQGEEPRIYLEQDSLDRQFLLDLKREQQNDALRDTPDLQKALKRASELIADLEAKIGTSPIPERVVVDEIDEWFYGLRLGHITT